MVGRIQTTKLRNLGLLIMRIGLGLMFILHGYPKLFGGPEMWEQVGAAMQSIGIEFLPVAFGFLAGITEFFGGIFMLFGVFFRPALAFLTLEMMIVTAIHLGSSDSFLLTSHSLEMIIVFISLILIGPGKYSFKNRLAKHRRRW